jgi:hypothetical protein
MRQPNAALITGSNPVVATHAAGGAINAVLAAAGYNFRRLQTWLRLLRACFLDAVLGARSSNRQLIAS